MNRIDTCEILAGAKEKDDSSRLESIVLPCGANKNSTSTAKHITNKYSMNDPMINIGIEKINLLFTFLEREL